MKERLGKQITVEWVDGPLRSMRLVAFEDGENLVQVDTSLATCSEPYTIGYCDTVRDVMVRFDREDVMNMLAILDGMAVKDWRDRDVVSVVEDDALSTPTV